MLAGGAGQDQASRAGSPNRSLVTLFGQVPEAAFRPPESPNNIADRKRCEASSLVRLRSGYEADLQIVKSHERKDEGGREYHRAVRHINSGVHDQRSVRSVAETMKLVHQPPDVETWQ